MSITDNGTNTNITERCSPNLQSLVSLNLWSTTAQASASCSHTRTSDQLGTITRGDGSLSDLFNVYIQHTGAEFEEQAGRFTWDRGCQTEADQMGALPPAIKIQASKTTSSCSVRIDYRCVHRRENSSNALDGRFVKLDGTGSLEAVAQTLQPAEAGALCDSWIQLNGSYDYFGNRL